MNKSDANTTCTVKSKGEGKGSLFMALIMSYSSLKRSDMTVVNEKSHSFTCHPHVYPQVEGAIPAFTAQPQSDTTFWLVLISYLADGRRLSWPGWNGEILRCPIVVSLM